jgi:hypothetical protein
MVLGHRFNFDLVLRHIFNAKKIKFMLLSRHQNEEQSHDLKIGNMF